MTEQMEPKIPTVEQSSTTAVQTGQKITMVEQRTTTAEKMKLVTTRAEDLHGRADDHHSKAAETGDPLGREHRASDHHRGSGVADRATTESTDRLVVAPEASQRQAGNSRSSFLAKAGLAGSSRVICVVMSRGTGCSLVVTIEQTDSSVTTSEIVTK